MKPSSEGCKFFQSNLYKNDINKTQAPLHVLSIDYKKHFTPMAEF